MALETGSYLADLNTANPAGTDPKAQGDDHIRLIKSVLKNSFAGFAGAVVVTGPEAQGASADDYVVTVSPAPAAYSASMVVVFKATHANTGAATLKLNALAAKALKAVDGGALEAADIESGALCAAFHDGTDFVLISGNDRAARGGESYGGVHDFTAATTRVATVAAADNSTKAASTAYVDAADALKAPLASPALTGTPTAPTAAPGANTTQIATTAFVDATAFASALPSQTGNSGKFVTTDGTNASWGFSIASQGEAETGTAADRLMTPQRTAQAIDELSRSAPDIIVEDQKSSGTAAQTLALSTATVRNLNTLVRNRGSLGSLSSNTLTLPAGTYLMRARAAATGNGANNSGHAVACDIYNSTDAAAVGRGLGIFIIRDDATNLHSGGITEAVAIVTIASNKGFQVRSLVGSGTNGPVGGTPISNGSAEVYCCLEVTRIGA